MGEAGKVSMLTGSEKRAGKAVVVATEVAAAMEPMGPMAHMEITEAEAVIVRSLVTLNLLNS